ncbi:MAG: hypothetical protein JAY94_14675 [Candidatus Thiodiazotropha endolucinida]|nr:hypothetical protein [Candidatus Thiodiazotropha taylori]MCW4318756.1 hypothetical protein [Candidatus Thiodiazotropha taylori]
MTRSCHNQASLDQALLNAQQQLFEMQSLLTVLYTSTFDLEATPYGEPMDPAAWSNVMVILRRGVQSAYEQINPFCMKARERALEAAESKERQK